MKIILAVFLLTTWACLATAFPKNDVTPNITTKVVNIIGQITNILTDGLLKDSVDSYSNEVFSPVAFAAILALINEGARGQTAQEFYDAFELPNERATVRNAFDQLFQRISGEESSRMLDYDANLLVSDGPMESAYLDSVVNNYYVSVTERNKFNGFNKYNPNVSKPLLGITPELPFCNTLFGRSNIIGNNNFTFKDLILEKVPAAENFRQMLKVQRSYQSNPREEIASALSGNTFDEPINAHKEGSLDPNWFNMFLMQGLSFTASWATPPQLIPEGGTFFINGTEKRVQMMRSSGKHLLGVSQKLDAKFVELPYDNERYSLLLMVPNKKDGFKDLIKNFNCRSLSSVREDLTQTQVRVMLPKFYASNHINPRKVFAKLNLNTMFTTEADLSGIMTKYNLYINDLEQSLSLRVTEGYSSDTDGNNVVDDNTTGKQVEQFTVDRPFLYFLRDSVDNVVLFAGKITDGLEVDDQNNGVETGVGTDEFEELQSESEPLLKEPELESESQQISSTQGS